MKHILSLLATLALAGQLTAQQQDFSKVEIKTTQVAGSIFMLEGSGGNIAVSAGPEGVLIVDSQFAPLSEKIEAAIEKLGKGKPKFLLNTHWHGDHTGGNANFGRYADIIARANIRKRLEASPITAKAALPVITFDDKLSVHFNGEEIKLLSLGPGHTDGDTVIIFTGSKVIHTGDQFVNARLPFFDLASGGNAEGYVKNLKIIEGLVTPEMKLIPGHGALGKLDDLKLSISMVGEAVDKVKAGVAAGKTLEQIKAEGLPDKYKSWGVGMMNPGRFLEATYNSLTQK